ncbi:MULTISPECIES: DUF2243 domain-containing protein [Shouchella]|uniref:DUF2243 domain-containing protein n=1 Tax=Shouchella TaxID=2893057 RepID=UPI002706B078|nr:DUF2243 domain-containing protein [Shouchella clausii]MDO7268999.1 DUF2243 domain-containing protein [Shouchella clausii]MDO7288784.1 DUF2243 domain-containing protein [Shouchella clausii]
MPKPMKQELRHLYLKRNLWSGVLVGVGIAAFLDEVLFHQLLQWHHFYDKSTRTIGIISDGIFHAFGWFASVSGMFLLADLKSRRGWWGKRWLSGILLGSGAFQLYDGTIQHKWMRIHQIRYVENVYIYDSVWNAIAILLVICGAVLVYRTGQRRQP